MPARTSKVRSLSFAALSALLLSWPVAAQQIAPPWSTIYPCDLRQLCKEEWQQPNREYDKTFLIHGIQGAKDKKQPSECFRTISATIHILARAKEQYSPISS